MSEFLGDWNEKSGRIIVFAGVFDPVHAGHLRIALEAERLHGEKVVFLPERVPQHKHGATSYEHRLEMIRIAAEEYSEDLSVLDYPVDHHGIVDTFTWLSEQFPGRTFAWLVGSDVVGDIEKWPGSDILSQLGVNLIVIAKRTSIPYEIPVGDSIAGVHTTYVEGEYPHISSEFVRADIDQRHDDLPEGVYDYIQRHNLY